MTNEPQPDARAGRFVRFTGLAVVVTAALAGLGVVIANRLTPPDAWRSVVAGCGISLAAALAAAYPLSRAPVVSWPMVMALGGLRFGLVVIAGVVAARLGSFETRWLLVALAVCYVALLPIDTWYALRTLDKREA